MAVDLNEYYDRRWRRRSSYWTRVFVNLVLGLVTMVPIYYVAWQMFNGRPLFGGRAEAHTETVTQEQSQPVSKTIPTLEEVLAERARRRAEQESAQAQQPPEPVVAINPPVADAKQHQPTPTHAITLSLKRHVQTEPMPQGITRIVGVTGCPVSHEILPPEGTLPATVRIFGPAPVKLDIAENDKGDLEIQAGVFTHDGDSVPFSVERMNNYRGAVIRRGQQATKTLAALKSEREQLVFWINAPVTKPLAARGAARVRVGVLDKLIPPAEQQIAALAEELKTAVALQEFAMTMDGKSELHLQGETNP